MLVENRTETVQRNTEFIRSKLSFSFKKRLSLIEVGIKRLASKEQTRAL